jgi:hypothetical protein
MFKIFGTAIDGVREFTTLGFTPAEEAYQTFNAIRSGQLSEIMERANPVVRAFLDWYYGKDSFYKTDIGNYLPTRYTKVIPERAQKILGLTKRMRPKYRGGKIVGEEEVLYGDTDTIFMIKSFPMTARFLNDLARVVNDVSAGKAGTGLTRYSTGIATKEIDIEKRKRMRAFRIKLAKRRLAKKRGAAEFKRIYAPKWQKKEEQSPYEKSLEYLKKLGGR